MLQALVELTPSIVILGGMIGSLLGGSYKLITRWYRLEAAAEKTRKANRTEQQSALDGSISTLQAIMAAYSAELNKRDASVKELQKQLLVMSEHIQTQNDSGDRLGELLAALVKVLGARPDLLEMEAIGEGRYKIKKKET